MDIEREGGTSDRRENKKERGGGREREEYVKETRKGERGARESERKGEG